MSDHGRVRNAATGYVLTPMRTGTKRPGSQRSKVRFSTHPRVDADVAHLVLTAFVGPRPPGMLAMHEDDDTTNNRLSNLQWGTPKDNTLDCALKGRAAGQKFLLHQIQEIVRRRAAGEKGVTLAREFGVSQQRICDVTKFRSAVLHSVRSASGDALDSLLLHIPARASMGQDSREEMLAAVNELTNSPAAKALFDSLVSIIRVAKLHPVKLDGDAAVLNPLLSLALRDPAAFDRVVGLIDSKRVSAGLEQLRPAEEKRFDKVAYQRDFMDHKRQRQRRAAEIENMARPPRDQLIGRHRLDFMDAQAAGWKVRLDDILDAARRELGSRLPRDKMESIRTQFWATVDAELDELEAKVRRPKK